MSNPVGVLQRPVSVSQTRIPAVNTRQIDRPGDILVTTPESLYLILTSQAREALRSVHTVILDEIHVLAGTKRGVHLSLSLERLAALADLSPDVFELVTKSLAGRE